MDIAALSIGMSQAKVKQQVDIALMKKVMDTSEQKGDFIDKMMGQSTVKSLEQAALPHLGSSVDVKV